MKTTLITNIKQLVGVDYYNITISKGANMAELPTVDNAFLLIEGETIKAFGPMDHLDKDNLNYDEVIDATGRLVLPAWVDSHTHLVFAGSRETEFVDKIKGLSYEEIAKRGGGILNSAARLQHTDEAELFDAAMLRIAEIKSYGTGAVEIKSGYGLTVEDELKILRVARKVKESTNLFVKTTFLGAHSFPAQYKENREGYVDLVINQMLPRVADEGLADYCDVFCERGFFTVDQTSRILEKAISLNIKPRLHANQLDFSGGVQVGVKYNALSVDHLEHAGDEEIEALLGSNTMPTLLPASAFFINLDYPPARKLIEAGLAVAIASDYNPGSSPTGNMCLVVSLACIKMKMLPEEAINAATINTAKALELSDKLGTIARGKVANLIITKPIPSYAYIPYAFGSNLVERVIVRGE
ncbi:MAG: imidazolonepropionase [Sphingobacteriales bacterium JAD_PAG50586_3]|nr:MAG: imidazolonepropionase [Sphingobacteriales bacterium JAD_PAG50586_3]